MEPARPLVLAGILVATALAGCIGGEGEGLASTSDDGVMETEIVLLPYYTMQFDGVLVASVGTPRASSNPNADPADFLFGFGVPSDATGLVIEMAWTPTLPTSQNLHLIVEDEGSGLGDPMYGEADGPSSLRIDLGGHDAAGKSLQTRTFASRGGGLAKDQTFTVLVTVVFDGVPVETVSALAPP